MTAAEKWEFVSVEDYLASEAESPVKHEYRDGVIYAMAGGRNAHHRIAGNTFGQLYIGLRGKKCQPFNSDTKIRIRLFTGTRFYYPDASVICEPKSGDLTFQDAPVVILEVTSASTRRTDLGEKKDAYLAIPSLAVYLVAEQCEPVVIAFRRTPDGEFLREVYADLDRVIPLPEIGMDLALADLYEGVEFLPEEVAD